MTVPETQMREIRLELHKRSIAVGDAIEALGKTESKADGVEMRSRLIAASDKLQAMIRNGAVMALDTCPWNWGDEEEPR